MTNETDLEKLEIAIKEYRATLHVKCERERDLSRIRAYYQSAEAKCLEELGFINKRLQERHAVMQSFLLATRDQHEH